MGCRSASCDAGRSLSQPGRDDARGGRRCARRPGLDWQVCYQSRVGPLEWIGPATDEEIRRAGREGVPLVVAPISFVSEHSETLVELDLDYRRSRREKRRPGLSPGRDRRRRARLYRRACQSGPRCRLDLGSGSLRASPVVARWPESARERLVRRAYPWIKSAHIVAVVAWMAGLLYLPRLFVYHAMAPVGSDRSETFKVMERRLLRGIMNPAMIAALGFGLLLAGTPGRGRLASRLDLGKACACRRC